MIWRWIGDKRRAESIYLQNGIFAEESRWGQTPEAGISFTKTNHCGQALGIRAMANPTLIPSSWMTLVAVRAGGISTSKQKGVEHVKSLLHRKWVSERAIMPTTRMMMMQMREIDFPKIKALSTLEQVPAAFWHYLCRTIRAKKIPERSIMMTGVLRTPKAKIFIEIIVVSASRIGERLTAHLTRRDVHDIYSCKCQ